VTPDVGLCAQVACVWEATARKPGNVHRYCDFEGAGYVDFLLSAAALAPVMTTACQRPVGATILEAVRATRRVVRTNTNLGIALLLAPLATVPEGVDLRAGVGRVLAGLTVEDARLAYEAIRLAAPGGLGRAAEQDVRAEPTQTLRKVMALAAGRDLIARQYTGGFADVFDGGAPAICAGLELTGSVEGAIIRAHLMLMACRPDTLIARKRGPAEAAEAAVRARQVLEEGWPHRPEGRAALAELDGWLRAEGNGRNPGATADLIAASLFVLLREGTIPLPAPLRWSAGDETTLLS
jgi:triphosphoribosyl-dephospho-CoA synthase